MRIPELVWLMFPPMKLDNIPNNRTSKVESSFDLKPRNEDEEFEGNFQSSTKIVGMINTEPVT